MGFAGGWVSGGDFQGGGGGEEVGRVDFNAGAGGYSSGIGRGGTDPRAAVGIEQF